MNVKVGLVYTCNTTCKMNVGATCAVNQKTKIVSIRPMEANGSQTMFPTEQRWNKVVTTNEKRKISTSRERAELRDVLKEKHRS